MLCLGAISQFFILNFNLASHWLTSVVLPNPAGAQSRGELAFQRRVQAGQQGCSRHQRPAQPWWHQFRLQQIMHPWRVLVLHRGVRLLFPLSAISEPSAAPKVPQRNRIGTAVLR